MNYTSLQMMHRPVRLTTSTLTLDFLHVNLCTWLINSVTFLILTNTFSSIFVFSMPGHSSVTYFGPTVYGRSGEVEMFAKSTASWLVRRHLFCALHPEVEGVGSGSVLCSTTLSVSWREPFLICVALFFFLAIIIASPCSVRFKRHDKYQKPLIYFNKLFCVLCKTKST